MKALFEFNKLILTILFTVTPIFAFADREGSDRSSAGREGGSAGGGANQVEEQFEMARTYLKNSLTKYKNNKDAGSKLNDKERQVIDENLDDLIEDVSDVSLSFDHETITPFTNDNGADSGIRTGGEKFAPIEIRTKVLTPGKKISTDRAIKEFGHELGHHIKPIKGYDEEQKAWLVSRALKNLLHAQVVAPFLLGINGHYIAVVGSENKVCRNLIYVEGDPFTGLLSIATSTSNGQGAYFPQCERQPFKYEPVGTFLWESASNSNGEPIGFNLWSNSPNESARPFLLPNGIQIHYTLSSLGTVNDKPVFWEFDLRYIRVPSPENN